MARKAYWVRNTASSNIFRLDGSPSSPYGFPLPHTWLDLKPNLSTGIGANQILYDVTTPADNPDSVWVVGKRKAPGAWNEKGIAYSQDAGNTWFIPVIPNNAAFISYGLGGNLAPDNCNKVCTVKDTASGNIIVYVACDNGFIMKCTDAYALNPVFTIVARINEPVSSGSSNAQNVQSIHFNTPLLGVVGLKDAVYYTTNGGVNWTKVSNDSKFKLSAQPPNPTPAQRNWEINGIVGIYIETITAQQIAAGTLTPCSETGSAQQGPPIQTGDISIKWVGTNGEGTILNTNGSWNSYRCQCPCNVPRSQFGAPAFNYPCCDSSIPSVANLYPTTTLYPFSHLTHVTNTSVATGTPIITQDWFISGSINQLKKSINQYSASKFTPDNTTQFPVTNPLTTRFCYNNPGIVIPANNTVTRWNAASAWYREQVLLPGVTWAGFILYNDGDNGISVGFRDFSTAYSEVVSKTWSWSYFSVPASYPIQSNVGTIWVAGTNDPIPTWQLTPCAPNSNNNPTVYTNTGLNNYADTVITDFYINNQLTTQCYTVTGPLQNYTGPVVNVVVDPALVITYPVSSTPAPGACFYCNIGCYKLIECGDPNNVQYVFTQNQATIDALVGSLYQTIQSPQICNNKCFYLTRCTGLPTNPILLDDVLQNESLQLTSYASCAECLGLPPPLEPKPRAVKPGFYTPGCPPEYTVKTSSMYAEQVYDEMVSIRYGINICCDHDIDKWDIKKQLLELKAIYDDCACETTLTPCPTCVEPCNVSAEATSYVLYEPPPPPPPCLLPTQVNIGITTTP